MCQEEYKNIAGRIKTLKLEKENLTASLNDLVKENPEGKELLDVKLSLKKETHGSQITLDRLMKDKKNMDEKLIKIKDIKSALEQKQTAVTDGISNF